jgi:hypothetical protein
MIDLDYYFTYKNSLRFLIFLKLGLLNNINTYNVPFLNKLTFFFSLSKSVDKDNISIYNYFYLFKFFFGKNAFLSKYKSYYNLGMWYYSFKVYIIIIKKEVYSYLFYYLNDFLSMIDKIYFKYGIFSNKLNILYIVLKDLTIFSEKKTNMGLFNLENSLNLHLYFSGGDINSSKLIMKNCKINFFK